jgi:hypothetical protein
MRTTVNALWVVAAVFAATGCASPGGASPQPLDGRKFAVTLSAEGQAPMSDDLIFKDGVFESTVCTNAGFAKSAYTTRLVAGGVAFDVQCDSPEYGHNDWHGLATGDRIEGTCVRTPKNGGAPIKSTFSGAAAR